MTTHERRVMALMRFHGLSKTEAEKRARSLAAKKNPAPKRKTKARTQDSAEAYVYRNSQVTKKRPSKRLVVRRAKNLEIPAAAGAFPNPVKKRVTSRPHRSARKMVYCVESGRSDKGPWRSEGIFPNEAKARNYAEALSASNPGVWLRVVLK